MPIREVTARDFDPPAQQRGGEKPRSPVDEALVRAVIQVESGGRPDAISPRGARGPMQLMPATARELGVDPNDPAQNIEGGTRYLSQLHGKYQDRNLALMAYNWGPGNVDKWLAGGGKGSVPKETRDYVQRVNAQLGMSSTAPAPEGGGSGKVREVTAADFDKPKEPIGAGRAALQGAFQGARDTAATTAYNPSLMGLPARVAGAVISRDPHALIDPNIAATAIRNVGSDYVAPPSGPLEAAIQGGTRGAVATLPTLGMGGAGPVLSVASGAAGGSVTDALIAAGVDPKVAMAAGLVTSLGVSAGPSAVKAAAGGRRLPGMDRGQEAAEIAAATQLRGAIGGPQRVPAAVAALDNELAGAAPGQARTAQVLADEAPGVLGLEGAQARRYPELQSAAAERLRQNENAVRLAERGIQQGDAAALTPAWQAARDASQGRVRAAYGAIDPAEVGAIGTRGLKAAAKELVDDAGPELAGTIPPQVRLIDGYGDTIDFSTLQRLRTSVSDTARQLAREARGSAAERAALRLKGAIDDEINALAAGGSEAAPALQTAIATRAQHGRLFDPRHPAVKALEGNERAGAVVDAIASGSTKRPTEEVRRVLSAVGRDTEAHEGLKRLWMDRALGGEALWDASVPKAMAFLRKNEAASREILGDEGHDLAVRMLERTRQLQYGRVGTPAMAMGTGSALPDAGETADAATTVLGHLIRGNPGKAISATAGKAWDRLLKSTTSDQRVEILNEALLNPKRARELLTTVTPQRFNQWWKSMESSIARQTARTAITSERD